MGGRAYSALNLAGFPRDFSDEWIGEILAGGFDAMKEAGCVVAGGHTIQAEEALFGFAVTGMIERRQLVTNAGAHSAWSRNVFAATAVAPFGSSVITFASKHAYHAPETGP